LLLRIELLELARARIREAKLLYNKRSYDGAAYLCGYGVEFSLKARICKHQRWPDFPSKDNEFKGKENLKTHNFNRLLEFTGIAPKIRTNCVTEWSALKDWSPDYRYKPIGSAKQKDVLIMITSAKTLMKKLQ
jgi:hypothetical protein